MKKMKLAACLCAAIVMVSIIGCTTSTKQSSETPNASGQSSKQPKQQDEGTAPDNAALNMGGKSIRIGEFWGQVNFLSEEEKEKQKKAEQKYNTKIEYVTVPYEELASRLITSSAVGESFADIIAMDANASLPKLVEEGYIREIDDLVDLNDPIFSKNKITMTAGTYNGKHYGIATPFAESNGFYYNKTIIQNAGLPDPYDLQQKGEWTWDKFLEMAKKTTKGDIFGLADKSVDLATFFIYANGGAVTKDNKIMFDKPEALEAIQFVADLINVHKVVAPSPDSFAAGKSAFKIGYRWDAAFFNKNLKDEWGYVFYPKGPKATDYVAPYRIMNLWFVSKLAKNPKAVVHAFTELQEMDVDKGYSVKMQKEEPNFRTKEALDTFRKMFDKIVRIDYPSYYGLEPQYNDAINSVLAGKETPATAMQRIKPLAQAAIDLTLKKKK